MKEKNLINELIFENILEKKRTRRWNIFFKSLFFIFTILIISSTINFKKNNFLQNKNTEHIAVIEINGIISEKNKTNAKNIINALNDAFENKNAKAIILKINSPGGTPVQSNIIYNHIKRLRNLNKNKPIFSVIEDIGTSGAYLISLATEKIYCDPSSIVGSIGVILNSFGFVDAINKLGIERRLYKAGKHKAIMDPFLEKNTEDDKIIQHNIDLIHENFKTIVKQNRINIKNNNTDIFSGKYWIGHDALEIGLIDGFYDIYTLASDIIKNNTLVDYNSKTNILNILN